MKKFFIFSITLILCASFLIGCSRSAPPDFVSYWGQLVKDGKNYLEYSEFKITVKKPDDDESADETEYKLDTSSEGVYKTTLTRDSDDGKASVYKLESSFEFNGKYNGHSFTDTYKSEVTFRVASDSFKTIESTKTVDNYTFLNEDGTISSVSFKVVNEYNNKKVTSTLTITKDPDNKLERTKGTYSGNLENYYFDNESLFFGIRSFTPNETFSLSSYSLLDPINQKISTMTATFVALVQDEEKDKDKDKIKLAEITESGTNTVKSPSINGNAIDTVECNLIRTAITKTNNTGAPIDLYYAKALDTDIYRVKYLDKNKTTYNEAPYYFLVKVEHGDMIYTLNTFDNQAQKA